MSIDDATALNQAAASNFITDSKGNFQLPCQTTALLEFALVGLAVTISPLDYIGQVQTTFSNGSTWCSSRIVGVAANSATTSWSIGTGFLRNVSPWRRAWLISHKIYTVFDYGNNQIQFGLLSAI
jgi:cathepsin D